jgi:hypothetical protein
MRPWYAINARALLESRQQGLKPEGWVTVSLVGGQFDALTLYLRADMPIDRLDWRMLADLRVAVEASPAADPGLILQVVHAIAAAKPEELRLHFATPNGELHQVDVGTGVHHPAVGDMPACHDFHWAPIALRGSAGELALCRALRRHQSGAML